MQNQNAFWKPPETCAIGKHPKGRVWLTTQLPVISPKNQFLPIAEFFLEVPSKKQGFWLCYDPVLNPSYTEMHPQELSSRSTVSNPQSTTSPVVHVLHRWSEHAELIQNVWVTSNLLCLWKSTGGHRHRTPSHIRCSGSVQTTCRALPGSVSFALQAR